MVKAASAATATRLPPLEAPVKPEWFGIESFRQTGTVRSQTSLKVSPFEEDVIRTIDQLRRAPSQLLSRYSFALADGVRWIPKKAAPLFEAALDQANAEVKELLGKAMGNDVRHFLLSQEARIRRDAQRMYETFHPGRFIPDDAVSMIMGELHFRLDKTKAEKLIPTISYSPIEFNTQGKSAWADPWEQASQLIIDIAQFPRKAMTDRFFWRGIRSNEDELIAAMDVADDDLIREYGGRHATRQAAGELQLLKDLDATRCDSKEKCRAVLELLRRGSNTMLVSLLTRSRDLRDIP